MKKIFLAISLIVPPLAVLALIVLLFRVVDDQARYIPCAYQNYKGEFSPGFGRKAWSQCFSCSIAMTEEQFAVCPPEYRAAFFKKEAEQEAWQKEHGYKPK